VSPDSESFIRGATRSLAGLVGLAGVVVLALELAGHGIDAKPAEGARTLVLAISGAMIVVGPVFWFLARAHLTILGAGAAMLLGGALVTLGALREGSDAGFDLGLGLCLIGVALWTLWGHARGT
jgi:hypothetical protein